MTERTDPILDACLHEVLGGVSPPDLSARILHEWARRSQASASTNVSPADIVPPPIQIPTATSGSDAWQVVGPVPPPIAAGSSTNELGWVAPVQRSRADATRGRAPAPATWQSVALVLMVLCTGTTVGLVALNFSSKRRPQESIAKDGGKKTGGAVAGTASQDRPRIASTKGSSAQSPQERNNGQPFGPGREAVAAKSPSKAPHRESPQDPPSSADFPGTTPPATAATIADDVVVHAINEALHREWQAAGVAPSEPATDTEWCRRAFLRVIGRIPTVEEVDRYVSNRSPHKQAELVDELLGPRYAEAYATHWATIWSNTLLGRRDPDKSLANRDGLAEYLKESLEAQKPFDQVATELITATGSNRQGAEDYNPAVNFLLGHAQGNTTRAASRVARVFLGARLQCAECHVHPAGSWTQDQLWQLAAFFRQMKVSRGSEGAVRLVNEDVRSQGKDPDEVATYFELANGKLKAAFPVFLDGSAGSRSGLVSEVDRRAELARFVTHSPQFTQTVVNRLWAHFLGFGFTQPIDDLGPHNQPSHPAILQRVAQDFASQGYDLKRLTRWIVLSETFGLSSKEMPDSLVDSPEQGRRPLFARYYSRPMQPEELSKSLQMLVDARGKTNGKSVEQARILGQLGRTLPSDDTDAPPGSRLRDARALIDVQRDFALHSLEGADQGLIRKVAENKAMSSDDKIEHLFQAALARKPSSQEIQAARRLLADSPADVRQGLQDLWWVLVNSNEFILDH